MLLVLISFQFLIQGWSGPTGIHVSLRIVQHLSNKSQGKWAKCLDFVYFGSGLSAFGIIFVQESMSKLLPIKAVVKATGLTAHTIRAWEIRYGVVVPQRSDTNRRLYTEEDVLKLKMLREATLNGVSIKQLSQLEIAQLREMVSLYVEQPESETLGGVQEAENSRFYAECILALETLDEHRLSNALDQHSATNGVWGFLENLVIPLINHVDLLWSEQQLSIAQEHLASTVLKAKLTSLRKAVEPQSFNPRIVVTTPAHQMHELGAAIAATASAYSGWNVSYLGPNVPAQEIILTAKRGKFDAVALSVVYPLDDPNLANELNLVSKGLPEGVRIILGGRGAKNYMEQLSESKFEFCGDIASLRNALARK